MWLCAIRCSAGAVSTEKLREKKTTRYREQNAEKVAEYQQQIINISPEEIAYVDETGIDTYLYREYGYAPMGELVCAQIPGRKYARTGIVAAKLGDKILVPGQYNGTMNPKLFEDWFENVLFPELPKGTVIVMDNASFHRKKQLKLLAKAHECRLIFLPPYSPELNPIEHF